MQEFEPIEQDTLSEEPPRGPGRRRALLLALAAVLIVAAVIVVVLLQRQPPPAEPVLPEPPPMPAPIGEPPPEVEEPEPDIELPPLDASDELVRQRAAGLSRHPAFADWLAQDDLIRTFVAVVQNLSEGTTPRQHLQFLAPRAPFEVEQVGERTFIAESSYRRYDRIADVVAAFDVRRAVRLYRLFQPLVDEAFREIGRPGRTFEQAVREAARPLLDVPVLDDGVEVVLKVTTFELADPELEGMSSAQRQLLRMGPRNVRLIQAKLREGLAALESR